MRHIRLIAATVLVVTACTGAEDAGTTSLAPESTTTEPVTETRQTSTTALSATTTHATTTTTAPTTTTTTQPEIELPSYSVVAEEDVSFPGAVRLSVRVAVESGTEEAQLRALAAELTTQYRASHEYQALAIFFYHYPELAFDNATLGRWEDAPFGDWGRADEVERGDYSNHQPFDDLKEKDWSLLPTQEEVDLYVAYVATYDEMDTGDELPSDDDVFEAVAGKHGVTPGDVERAANGVLDWMFND